MNKKIVVLLPMAVGVLWSGVVFFKTLNKGMFDWRFYASLTGFVILLVITIWFSYLLLKRN